FERPEGSLAYDDSGGNGKPVLMLPGMADLRSEYRFLAPELMKRGYRVVTVDLRGQGESSAFWSEYSVPAVGQDILKLIQYLKISPVNIIANSFSPASAVWLALEQPEVVKSLILISAFLRNEKLSLVRKLSLAILLHGPWKVSAWLSYFKSLYPTKKPDDFNEYIIKLKANLKEDGRFDAAMALGSSSKESIENRLNQVKTPTLVIVGTKDPDWSDPKAEAKLIANKLSAKLLIVESAGHYPQTEMPEKVTPEILDFLKANS
ncbi:MAG: alpha/beta hydrolase, partial [Candidatus Bathyarchaeota archaeon]